MSVLNKVVSYYSGGVTHPGEGRNSNLLSILRSNIHKEVILRLRQSNELTQKQIKSTLPCYTVSGIFSRRCDDGLIKSSGLAAIDLDSAENYDIPHLLSELKKVDCIAYAGLSCRGGRLFCIVPFKYPDQYVRQYEQLIKSFSDMGLPMGDDCHKRISQPRLVSWNEPHTQFFNHTAKKYGLLSPERIYHPTNYKFTGSIIIPDTAFQWCVEQINKSRSFSKGERHNYMIYLARYCNLKGVPENKVIDGCQQFIQEDFPWQEIKKIIQYIYKNHKDSYRRFPFK